MSLHAVFEYLDYRWKAKSRHGVHSPFVYDLAEHVLLNKEVIDRAFIIECPQIPLKYENLISRVASRYRYSSVMRPDNNSEIVPGTDMLLVEGVSPAEWLSLFNKYSGFLRNEGAVAITGIHKTIAHSNAWKMLCADERVRMSIDVYGVGLLFFRKEFKEKQHFILKY
jgi:hypothetical protein